MSANIKAVPGFGDLGGMLGGVSLAGLTEDNGVNFSFVWLNEISVKPQVREQMEDEDQTIAELAATIEAQGLLHPILLRYQDGEQPYQIVCGERRYLAHKLLGREKIAATIREMTDEEAYDAKLTENIHRKNLVNDEEVKRVQRDLKTLGSVEAVLAKYKKSHSWLSKIKGLIDLPAQTARLVSENISADKEVIATVKVIEKIDPKAAEKVVKELKDTRGKKDARDVVQKAKDAVKPPKVERKPKPEKPAPTNPANVAKPIDRSHEAPSPVTIVSTSDAEFDAMADDIFGSAAGTVAAETTAQADYVETSADKAAASADELSAIAILDRAYSDIYDGAMAAKAVHDGLSVDDRKACSELLGVAYEAGVSAPEFGRAVMQGLRRGEFAVVGYKAFKFAAFLMGGDSEAKFNLLNVLGCVKK